MEVATAPALRAREVSLTYANGVRALNGASLEVAERSFLALIGPNGSGKSSLLRVLAGLQAASSGEVLLNGKGVAQFELRDRARRVALVPQLLEVPPAYSAEEFVLLGRYAHLAGWRLFTRHDREVARRSLARVQADEFAERRMGELSGGERQRILIARAIAQESAIVLLDEPTSALDLKHQVSIYRLIRELNASGTTIVVVTHDLNLASQFADKLALMEKGKVAASGSASEVLRREVLEKIYGSDLEYGNFGTTISGEGRPWVLPWAKPR